MKQSSEMGGEKFSLRDLIEPLTIIIALCSVIGIGIYAFFHYRPAIQERFVVIHGVIKSNGDNPFTSTRLTQAQINARDNVTTTVKTPAGFLQWPVLARANIKVSNVGNHENALPVYTPALKAMNGKAEEAIGYMFPLDESGKQYHFLLSPYPPSCPYCLPAGPQQLIEVKTKEPVDFTYDTLKVKGVFHLLSGSDVMNGMLYRMADANIEK